MVTGLSFLLAFVTIAINHSNVYSLAAGAVLAAGLVVIVGRMQWFELEVFGIVASYLNHYLWLRPIIEPMQGKHHPFQEFTASAGILVLYWLIFRVSYVFRKPDEYQERISTAAALLNTSSAAGLAEVSVRASGVGVLGAAGSWRAGSGFRAGCHRHGVAATRSLC